MFGAWPQQQQRAQFMRLPHICCCTAAIFFLCFFSKTSLAWGLQSSQLFTGTVTVEMEYHIRDSSLEDLQSVSNLAVNCFYNNPSSTWRHHYRMETFVRLKSFWPRDSAERKQHWMLVAALANKPEEAIGFCRFNNMPPSPHAYFKSNPRPLITDLMVSPSMQRKGIARKMVEICEWICVYEFKCPAMYLRVVDENGAARALYEGLGFEYVDCAEEGHPELLMLRKTLSTAKTVIKNSPSSVSLGPDAHPHFIIS